MTAERLVSVDLSKVNQGAQIIANQITLDALFVLVVKASLKYTYAQKNQLLLTSNEQLQIKAISNGLSGEVTVLQSIFPNASKEYPHIIDKKVHTSNTSATLNYGSSNKNHASDPYLVQHHFASLCFVILLYLRTSKLTHRLINTKLFCLYSSGGLILCHIKTNPQLLLQKRICLVLTLDYL